MINKQLDKYYEELNYILNTEGITTVFQPIVSLSDSSIIGYEALSRGIPGSLLEKPDMLFKAAKNYNKVWEAELLCRTKAVKSAVNLPEGKKLFLNVDPDVIRDEHFTRGFTREFLLSHNMDPACIIFEITEKTAVEDYKKFSLVLNNYVDQGYKIAIDDTGSGYSGLKMLAETHPKFIKIDMDLIRDIDKDSFKQALLRSFLNFSQVTDISIIAEGIETLDELETLMEIGIPYGQGYFLSRPKPSFEDIPDSVKEHISDINNKKALSYFYNSETEAIGNIVRHDTPIHPDMICQDVKVIFEKSSVQGLVVVNKINEPVGLVMKSKFNERLATMYGVAVYTGRPIKLVMDTSPLIVDLNTSLSSVATAAMARNESNLYDYIIITKDCKYHGITTVKRLLERTTSVELNYARHLSPLTGLPGNVLIEQELIRLTKSLSEFSILYFDIDNFKAYNDVYGFENGDHILKATAEILHKKLNTIAGCGYFLGHIGGDDFLACLYSEENIDKLCSEIIEDFEVTVSRYYNETDKNNGYITAYSRSNILESFPIMTISIAAITFSGHSTVNTNHIAEIAAGVKKKCKAIKKSCYLQQEYID